MAKMKPAGAARRIRSCVPQDPKRRPLPPVRQRRRPTTATEGPLPPAQSANASSGDAPSYPVGRGRPPKEFQFKPGQSGFPSGRPKGSKNVSTYIDEALATRVGSDGSRRVPMAQIVGTRIVSQAAKGSARQQQMLLDREKARAARAEANGLKTPARTPEEMEAIDRSILEEFIRMVREGKAEPNGDDEPEEGDEP